jgi:hypothetical protein
MLPSSRAKIMGVVSEWIISEMLAYLIRRTAYVQRQMHERPAGSAMPIDLPIIADQLNAWLDRRSDVLQTLRSRVQCFKLAQIHTLVEALQREHARWAPQAAPLFTRARDGIAGVLHAIRYNIEADVLLRESAHFDDKSQTLLQIIEARLTAPAGDSPQGREREHLQSARQKIANWRKRAMLLSLSTDERLTQCDRSTGVLSADQRPTEVRGGLAQRALRRQRHPVRAVLRALNSAEGRF